MNIVVNFLTFDKLIVFDKNFDIIFEKTIARKYPFETRVGFIGEYFFECRSCLMVSLNSLDLCSFLSGTLGGIMRIRAFDCKETI